MLSGSLIPDGERGVEPFLGEVHEIETFQNCRTLVSVKFDYIKIKRDSR